MTKIYTKGGDKGQTGLFSGERVSKNDPLINALGTVDELNSVLGVARSFLADGIEDAEDAKWHHDGTIESWERRPDLKEKDESHFKEAYEALLDDDKERMARLKPARALDEMLHIIQLELFELGAELASGQPGAGRITDSQIERFERWIDELTAGLPPLKNFILPTGHPVAAHLHQARTVSRRAERMIVAAWEASIEEVGQAAVPVQDSEVAGPPRFDPVVIRYMNRLNDLLFVLAREGNRVFGVTDEEWHSPQSAG